MSNAPKCKICGSNHFGSAHVWPGAPKPVIVQAHVLAAGPETAGVHAKPDADAMIDAVMVQVAAGAKTFDKVAYQREYMRRRRAK